MSPQLSMEHQEISKLHLVMSLLKQDDPASPQIPPGEKNNAAFV